jgi:tripartite-type tricarboxylate transporter receptor subunit TctC
LTACILLVQIIVGIKNIKGDEMSTTQSFFKLVIAAVSLGVVAPALAESYPSKSVRIVVIVAPGGSADAIARLLAEGLSSRLGQPVIVENKPGAGGNLATVAVARSPADGYTLLLTANNHTINPSLFANAGYSIDDFAPIAALMEGPSVIAVPANSKYHTLTDLLDDARQKPATIAFGSAGAGVPSHIAGEMLQRAGKVSLIHIPYRGSGPSIADAVGGQVPVVIASLVAAMPQVEGGKLRALAVTSQKRWPSAPNIPAASEFGMPQYEHMTWLGLFAPKGTPIAIVNRLNAEVRSVLGQESIKQRVTKMGGLVALQDVASFESVVRKDYVASTRLVLDAKLRAD